MPRRIEIPEEFRDRAFSVREAQAAGVGRGRLSGRDLETPHRGARAAPSPDRLEDDAESALRHCRSLAPLLAPGQFFSHTTAARLWGCAFQAAERREVLHVSTRAPGRAPRRAGVVWHQVSDARVTPVLRFGMPVADPASAFLQLAALLDLDELVAAGDHLILDPHVLDPYDIRPHVRFAELQRREASFDGRGARNASSAIHLMRQGAESRPETLLRLLLRRAGFPEPEVNAEVIGIRRRWTHRADLVYRPWRVIAEYDGDQHRTDSRQYELDIRRFDDLAEDGWRVIWVRKRGLFVTPAETIDRVRAALVAGGWAP